MNISDLLSSEQIIRGGLLLITLIVFLENGVFFCFFLPGDYLLFSAGLFCGTGDFNVSIYILLLCVWAAAVGGSALGYFTGILLGDRLMKAKESLFFKREYIVKTRYYYIKYAGNTLIIGRFLPIVRTFAPLLAGIIKMDIRRFMLFNVLGGTIWVFVLILGGFYLGQKFPQILNYLEYIILGFVGLTSIVVIRGLFTAKKSTKNVG